MPLEVVHLVSTPKNESVDPFLPTDPFQAVVWKTTAPQLSAWFLKVAPTPSAQCLSASQTTHLCQSWCVMAVAGLLTCWHLHTNMHRTMGRKTTVKKTWRLAKPLLENPWLVNSVLFSHHKQNHAGDPARSAHCYNWEDIPVQPWAGWETLHWADALCEEEGTGKALRYVLYVTMSLHL